MRVPDDLDGKIAGLLITIDDIRKAGHCAIGARDWFIRHGFNPITSFREGVDARLFIEKGDVLAEGVVRHKLKRQENRSEHG